MKILQKNPPGETGWWIQLVEKDNGDLVVQVLDAGGTLRHEQLAQPQERPPNAARPSVLTPGFGVGGTMGVTCTRNEKRYDDYAHLPNLVNAIGLYSGED